MQSINLLFALNQQLRRTAYRNTVVMEMPNNLAKFSYTKMLLITLKDHQYIKKSLKATTFLIYIQRFDILVIGRHFLQVNFVIIAIILQMKLLYCHHIEEKVPTLSPVFSVQLLTPLGDILSSPHLAPLQFREYFVAN